MVHESQKHIWYKWDGKVYYCEEPLKALTLGAAVTEDTHEVISVGQDLKNQQPCVVLTLNKRSYEPSLAMREMMPKLKLVPEEIQHGN